MPVFFLTGNNVRGFSRGPFNKLSVVVDDTFMLHCSLLFTKSIRRPSNPFDFLPPSLSSSFVNTMFTNFNAQVCLSMARSNTSMHFFFRAGERLSSGYIGEFGGGDVDDDGTCSSSA